MTTDLRKPAWVQSLDELENYAHERGWEWARMGHATLIRRLIDEHRHAMELLSVHHLSLPDAGDQKP